MLPLKLFSETRPWSSEPGTLLLRGLKDERPRLICGERDHLSFIELASEVERGFRLEALPRGLEPVLAPKAYDVEVDWESYNDPMQGHRPGTLYLIVGNPYVLVRKNRWFVLVGLDGRVREANELHELLSFTSWQLTVKLDNGERIPVATVTAHPPEI